MNFPPLKNIIKPLINFFVYKYNKEFNKDIETGVEEIINLKTIFIDDGSFNSSFKLLAKLVKIYNFFTQKILKNLNMYLKHWN